MPKPRWLVEHENRMAARAVSKRHLMCMDCRHYGAFHHWAAHNGSGRYDQHECAIHPGCINNEFSIACADWES